MVLLSRKKLIAKPQLKANGGIQKTLIAKSKKGGINEKVNDPVGKTDEWGRKYIVENGQRVSNECRYIAKIERNKHGEMYGILDTLVGRWIAQPGSFRTMRDACESCNRYNEAVESGTDLTKQILGNIRKSSKQTKGDEFLEVNLNKGKGTNQMATLTKKNVASVTPTVAKRPVGRPPKNAVNNSAVKLVKKAEKKIQAVEDDLEELEEVMETKSNVVKRPVGRPKKIGTPPAPVLTKANKNVTQAIKSVSKAAALPTKTVNKVATKTNTVEENVIPSFGRGRPRPLTGYTKGQNVQVVLETSPNKVQKAVFLQISKKDPNKALVQIVKTGEKVSVLPKQMRLVQ